MRKLRINWTSNARHVGSGYGTQTNLFTKLMAQDGHQVVVRATYGLSGVSMRDGDGILTLPSSYHDYGDDVLNADWNNFKPDVAVYLLDAWVLSDDTLKSMPLTGWIPVDHEPMPPLVREKLGKMRHVWAMSRFGEREMHGAGFDPWYVPHGVDTNTFNPIDRSEARKKLGYPDDWFVVVSVAANKGFPSRKNLPNLFAAWSDFIRKHPKSVLYVHAVPTPVHGGYHLRHMREDYGIPATNLTFPDDYRLVSGQYTPQLLNLEYNAADAFILPSKGEGFGIPAVEAQAAGCPVILSDFTAQAELVGSGIKIPVDRDDLEYSPQRAFWFNAPRGKILAALEVARDWKGNEIMRRRAREFAMEYDAKHVYERYMRPALECIAEMDHYKLVEAFNRGQRAAS